VIGQDPTGLASPDAPPGVILFHGIARTSRSLWKLDRALRQAGFAR